MKTPDFQQVVSELLSQLDVSEENLARMLRERYGFSVSQSTIHRIRRGMVKAPRWEHATALIELHSEVVPQQAA